MRWRSVLKEQTHWVSEKIGVFMQNKPRILSGHIGIGVTKDRSGHNCVAMFTSSYCEIGYPVERVIESFHERNCFVASVRYAGKRWQHGPVAVMYRVHLTGCEAFIGRDGWNNRKADFVRSFMQCLEEYSENYNYRYLHELEQSGTLVLWANQSAQSCAWPVVIFGVGCVHLEEKDPFDSVQTVVV